MNTLPDMGATFVAVGPAFKTNTTLPVFSNLEVYPALAKILGIAPVTPIDGKFRCGWKRRLLFNFSLIPYFTFIAR